MFSVVAPLSTASWQHLAHEVDVGAAAVLGRELDVVAVARGPGDAAGGLRLHLVLGHPQLLLHVDRRRRDEDVDARLLGVAHRLPRPVDVLERRCATAPAMIGPVHRLGDGLDRLEVALAGDREPGLDDVDARGARAAPRSRASRPRRGRSPATARRPAGWCRRSSPGRSWLALLVVRVQVGFSGNEKPPRPEGTRRRPRAPEGCPQLRKEEALGAQFLRHGPTIVPGGAPVESTHLPPIGVRRIAAMARRAASVRSGSVSLAGAAYAVWRGVRASRPRRPGVTWEPQPFPFPPAAGRDDPPPSGHAADARADAPVGRRRRRRVPGIASGQGQAGERHLPRARRRELRPHRGRPLLRDLRDAAEADGLRPAKR